MVLGVGRTHKDPIARQKGLDHPENSIAFEGLPHLRICREGLTSRQQGGFPKVAGRDACPGCQEQVFAPKHIQYQTPRGQRIISPAGEHG